MLSNSSICNEECWNFLWRYTNIDIKTYQLTEWNWHNGWVCLLLSDIMAVVFKFFICSLIAFRVGNWSQNNINTFQESFFAFIWFLTIQVILCIFMSPWILFRVKHIYWSSLPPNCRVYVYLPLLRWHLVCNKLADNIFWYFDSLMSALRLFLSAWTRVYILMRYTKQLNKTS